MTQFTRIHYLPETQAALAAMAVRKGTATTNALGETITESNTETWSPLVTEDIFKEQVAGDVYASWRHTDGTTVTLFVNQTITYQTSAQLNPFVFQEVFVVRRVTDREGEILIDEPSWTIQDRQQACRETEFKDRLSWYNNKSLVASMGGIL